PSGFEIVVSSLEWSSASTCSVFAVIPGSSDTTVVGSVAAFSGPTPSGVIHRENLVVDAEPPLPAATDGCATPLPPALQPMSNTSTNVRAVMYLSLDLQEPAVRRVLLVPLKWITL